MGGAVARPQPWTVDALYALPEDGMRHELLDGTLLVSPPPTVAHQLAARRLVARLAAAAPADVEVVEAVGVALPAGLVVPDVVVAAAAAVHAAPRNLAAGHVLAVVEIVSVSSRGRDRRWKREAYAEAGIPAYWQVEVDSPRGPGVVVLALAGDDYAEVARGRARATVDVPVPFPVFLDPAELEGPAG